MHSLFTHSSNEPCMQDLSWCIFCAQSLKSMTVTASQSRVCLSVHGQSDLAKPWSFYHQANYVVMRSYIIDNHTPVTQIAQITWICLCTRTHTWRPNHTHTGNSWERVDTEAWTLPWHDEWLFSPFSALQYVLIQCYTAPFPAPAALWGISFSLLKTINYTWHT